MCHLKASRVDGHPLPYPPSRSHIHIVSSSPAHRRRYDAGAAFEEVKARMMEEMTGRSPWDESFGAGSSDEYRSDDDESICWEDEAGGE